MVFTKYSTKDTYVSSNTLVSVYNILSEMDGVMDWVLDQNGEVLVEYDQNRINAKIVEEALAGIGLKHGVRLAQRR